MDMLEGVGRRSGAEKMLDLGIHSMNGYERNGLFRNNGDGTSFYCSTVISESRF